MRSDGPRQLAMAISFAIAGASLAPSAAQQPADIGAAAPAGVAPDADGARDTIRATFFERLEAMDAGNRDEVLDLATWAFEQGLLEEAEAFYRLLLERDPRDAAAFAALWHLSDGRPLPKTSEAYDAARAGLDADRFHEHETPRYIVLSDADRRWTREQADRLERAYDRFIRFANQLDLRPLPLRHKLVAVVFERFDDFAPYAEADGNEAARRIAGYYSPAADRLVFYHVESSASVASARDELERELAEIETVRAAARRLSSTGRRDEARRMERDLEARVDQQLSQEQRLNEFARGRAIAVTVHEAIHQLSFHTEVQSPRVRHPLWLSEGLATAFETERPELPFGPFDEHWPRRGAFIYALERNELTPLRSLVGSDSSAVHRQPRSVHTMYVQSYALFTWMCRTKKIELREYLSRLNRTRGVLTPARQGAIFEEVFGEIDRVERTWLRHERNRWLD